MSLVYQIPKTAKYLQTRNQFTANFNVPSLGLYDFAIAGNAGQLVIPMLPNTIYLINQITIGGTIPQEEYLFNLVTLPLMTLRYQKELQRIYTYQIPIVQFVDGAEAVAWFWTDKSDDSLLLDLNVGQLSQDAFLVGTASIKINVTLAIFEIQDNGFIQEFKNDNDRGRIGLRTGLNSNTPMFAR